jgi:hypothetical protein
MCILTFACIGSAWILFISPLFLALNCEKLPTGEAAHSQQDRKPFVDFIDVAEKAGLRATNVFGGKQSSTYILESTGTGVAIFDYDNDGWPDIFFVNGTTLETSPGKTLPTNHVYRNNQDGTFSDVTGKTGLRATGWGQGVCVGDYDNDGWEDLYVTYFGRNRLYHNLGGSFEEIGGKSGAFLAREAWGTGCAFVDYDRDGRLDLFVANYAQFDLSHAPSPGEYPGCLWKGIAVFCGPRGLTGNINTLYHNLGNGQFLDVTAAAGIDRTLGHFCFSASPLDFDNDAWPDIFVACDSTPSILYHNQRDGTFHDVGIFSGVSHNVDGREQAGMGSAVSDYNGDATLDIFRTNFSDDTSTLYRNNGDGTFDDVTYLAGLGLHTRYLGWGTAFFDFDNDGWPDLLAVNGHVYPEVDTLKLGIDYSEPKLLYHSNGNGTFSDISNAAGRGIRAPSPARGLAVGDLWNTGRLSAVIVNRNETPNLLTNRVSYPNHWIAFKLVGTRSNRSGIGARLILRADARTQIDEVRSGSSYLSNSDMRVHFGLAAAIKVEYLEVRWPSGLIERFRNPRVDTIVAVKEGSGEEVRTSN